MSGFLKRLSRSRGNSASYVEDSYQRSSTSPTTGPGQRPPSSYHSPAQFRGDETAGDADLSATLTSPINDPGPPTSKDPMYPSSGGGGGGYAAARTQPLQTNGMRASRGQSSAGDSGYVDGPTSPGLTKEAMYDRPPQSAGGGAPPDLLTRAFNEAIRPYTEKIEQLEGEMADLQEYVRSQEQQRMEIFAWIDKRGLRPDVPKPIANMMDASSAPQSAHLLNAQLDRKITIVNFDLHRLQDDLNDSISSAHFASAMAKFLPDIERLSALRGGGAKFAYELIIKLVGNLNSHGGLDAMDNADAAAQREVEEDQRARAMFYRRMDEELVKVVERRAAAERAGTPGDGADNDGWGKAGVAGEVKRLERNAAYLKNLGIAEYFPQSLEVMRAELQRGPVGAREGGGSSGGYGTPPRYGHG